MSGEIPQQKRVKTLEDFRSGKIEVLVATDVAGRGIHIDGVTHVVNYQLPEDADDYVHRIGRTGRAGATGTSICFACENDSFLIPDIEAETGVKLECIHPDAELLADLYDERKAPVESTVETPVAEEAPAAVEAIVAAEETEAVEEAPVVAESADVVEELAAEAEEKAAACCCAGSCESTDANEEKKV